MENNTNKTSFLTTGCETNSNEDLFTKQQQQLKVIMILLIKFRKTKTNFMFRKKQNLLLYLVQKWLECKLKLNDKD